MQRPPATFCPLVHGACKQFECLFWVQLRGTHPQTGQELDEFDCSIRWLPVLLIEGAKETRQAAAAIESLRNRVVEQHLLAERVAEQYGSPVVGVRRIPSNGGA